MKQGGQTKKQQNIGEKKTKILDQNGLFLF